MATHDREYVFFGDFNEVREEAERFGSLFNADEANVFIQFLGDTGLLDVPLGGRRFTWINKSVSKMSRIDRVLVSSNVQNWFMDLKLVVLTKGWSDHLPLIFHNAKLDFGPIPFKCFNSWLDNGDFISVVKEAVGSE
ncbi:uncharacterized protein [Rutidosis leptorrhynchoides]|uniref:uncharacterized protein n=1 Tax=Rutidosis leptorrhynchoides TaxID=125765 RepID=UPI003A992E42